MRGRIACRLWATRPDHQASLLVHLEAKRSEHLAWRGARCSIGRRIIYKPSDHIRDLLLIRNFHELLGRKKCQREFTVRATDFVLRLVNRTSRSRERDSE